MPSLALAKASKSDYAASSKMLSTSVGKANDKALRVGGMRFPVQ